MQSEEQKNSDNFEKTDNNANGDFSNSIPVFNYSFEGILKEKSDKRKIRTAATITGIPFLCLILFSLFWKDCLFYVTDNIGINRENVVALFREATTRNVISAFISTFVFIVFFTLSLKVYGKKVSDVAAFEKPKKSGALSLFLMGFGFCMFANLLNLVMENFFEGLGTKYSVGSEPVENTWFTFITAVIATAVIPALVEEYACRGIVLGTLLPFGEGFAILSSSIVFGVMHGNFEQMPFAFLVGLVLGYVRVKSGSLWICILIHFANNMFSVANEYMDLNLSNMNAQALYVIFVIFALGIGMLGVFSFSNTEGALVLEKGSSGIKESKKYKWFFTAPVMIIAIVIYFLVSLKYFA